MRHPVRHAVLFGLASLAGIGLVLLGLTDMRGSGRTGSPWVMLGLFPALLWPIAAVYYLSRIRVFRDMRSGRRAIARWTLPAAQFDRFRETEERIPAGSILTNFYKPPRTTPAEGVDVIVANDGVLIGEGYFPLSTTRGRRLQSVRYVASDPPSIEFGTVIHTAASTSSATVRTIGTAETLRVPVSMDARGQAGEVVRHYQTLLDRR